MATTDPLDHLEERIQKTVALVHRLRDENDTIARVAADEKEAFAQQRAEAERVAGTLRADLEESRNASAKLTAEIDAMRVERQQVRTRLEKLLGHIDQLS
jgi:uncharacterized coiled-coil DUF342 family protein